MLAAQIRRNAFSCLVSCMCTLIYCMPSSFAVGHKADLEDQREVLYEEGEHYARLHHFKFVETSAMSGDNVNVRL